MKKYNRVGNQENQLNQKISQDNSTDDLLNNDILLAVSSNIPHSYLIILGTDFRIDLLSGQETINNNIDPSTYIGQSIDKIFEGITPEFQHKIFLAFEGQSSENDGYLNGIFYHIKIVPLMRANQPGRVMIVAENLTEKNRVETALEKRILALTKPISDVLVVGFEDLFSVDDIQKIQDHFAYATGVASIITKPDGSPITRPSNFCYLCNEIIRKTPQGQKNCFLSDAILGRQNPSGPIVQPCLSGGLWDAGASITVGGRHIANWLIGQVRNEVQSDEKMRAYAKTIQADGIEFMEAYLKVPKMSIEQFERIAQFLFILAEQLSNLAYQNIQQARFIIERKQAEHALSESEEKYRSYVNHSPYGVMISDRNWRILDINPMACSLSGYSIDELKNISIRELIYSEDVKISFKNITEIYKKGTGSLETRIQKKDGSVRWWYGELVKLSNNNLLFFFTDITEKKESQEELLKKNEEVNNYFSSALDLMAIVDKKGYFRRINPEWEKTLGYSVNEITNTKFMDYVHPEDIHLTTEAFTTLIKQEPILNFTNRYKHKDGSYRWIEWRSSPIRDMIYASARDITQRIEDEKASKENLQKFHAIFNSMSEGCALHEVVLSPDGNPINYRLLDANASYEKILGIKAEFIRGKLANEVYQTEEPPYLEEFCKVGISGRPYRFTTYFSPMEKYFEISISSPGPGRFATIFSDITQRVKDEEEIKLLNQTLEKKVIERTSELELANKEMEAFAYSVSHDLRAPLRSIDGFSQIILEDFSDSIPEDGKHYFDQVIKSTHQMSKLIDDLLRLSRIMRVDINRSEIDLSVMANQELSNLKEQYPDRRVAVVVESSMHVTADHNLIKIAMENLLRNAWKFTGNKATGKIEVGKVNEVDEIKYYVRDNGAGFDMAYVNKLFGAFQRLHTADEFEGIGIGLAIVQRVIQRHGGKIWAEGAVDHGATFWFTIPGGEKKYG